MDFKKELKAIEADVAGKEKLDKADLDKLVKAFTGQKDKDLDAYFTNKFYPNVDVPLNPDSNFENEAAFFQNLEKPYS